MEKYQYEIEMQVRDYECDFQGIVNNAVYQNYLEHARHQYLRNNNIDFIELSKKGIQLIVIRSEIDYLSPLKHSDKFIVGSTFFRKSRLRFGFIQDIYLLPGKKPVLKGLIVGTSVNDQGRPFLPEELNAIFEKLVQR
jgi:acyl-CoA thioester hydrolase